MSRGQVGAEVGAGVSRPLRVMLRLRPGAELRPRWSWGHFLLFLEPPPRVCAPLSFQGG